MVTGSGSPVGLFCFIVISLPGLLFAQVLTPPYFNLAQGRNITATATCGVGVPSPELYCRLTGTTASSTSTGGASNVAATGGGSTEVIQGQLCDYCNTENPSQDHRPEYATDGTEKWWQSPPLSRLGVELNRVNLTISLGQEFHVAYVFIKMANSPRPGVWVLERSKDFGRTWKPWHYFADTPSDCINFFNTPADERLSRDDQIICTTEFSKVVPLSNGEIVVSLVNGRPSALNFSYADELQEWTRATDVQLRLLRTKTLLGHLMAVARQDPTVTRRYYYSIKDISIGGRCVCNGHAETCDVRNPDTNKLICVCQHNTCGEKCEYCCPGFVQKKWRRALINQPFMCEPCECYGHSSECIFVEEVAQNRQSIDIHGKYEGGGVCQNCRDYTMGINCEQCVPGYYRPYDVPRNATDACRPCVCDLRVSTGECEEGSGRCLCRPEYAGVNCDRCNFGYYGYPDCIPCECNINGTEGSVCTVGSGRCPCKYNYAGDKCDMCAQGYYNFPECRPCECNPVGSPGTVCNLETGQCRCQGNFGGRDCGECANGYYGFPRCQYCDCDPAGTEEEICDKDSGECLCKPNYTTDRCDRCMQGFYNFPVCQECQCAEPGSLSPVCAENGQCRCQTNFGGLNCDRCAPGYYKYSQCTPCNCDVYGSLGQSCDQLSGQCVCRSNFVGVMCEKCGENFYNYPMCEVCNCNPDGAKEIPGYPLGGCGIVTTGLLCECKDKVMGRICDMCKPGYWNLNRNNPEGCEACECFKPGTLSGVSRCDMQTGQCMCKPHVVGQDCDRCQDGFFSLQEKNPFGCTDCNCDRGGSQRLTCDKNTGQCICKPRVSGLRCEHAISGHFVPTLHQYKYEIEDGVTPEGARVRYGYDERIFPSFSWRGYAILTSIQPEVLLDVNIRIPSLYQIIYRFVNRQDNPVKGTVNLVPESPTDITQTGEIAFVPSRDSKFATVTSGGVQSFVLNPGKWTISTKVPENVFLDYFVLIPQSYYEASELQERVSEPCRSSSDPGPCIEFKYPDLRGYPNTKGIDGYLVIDGQRQKVALYPDIEVTNSLGSEGLAHVNKDQNSFLMDLVVPRPDEYYIIMVYHNPRNVTQNLDIEVATRTGRRNAMITLASCPYSSACHQVLKTPDGLEAIFNITTGYATLYIKSPDEGMDVNVAIDAVYGIPRSSWKPDYILPRIICIKINGVCVPSTYGRPVGAIRIDFEQPPNQDLRAKVLPPNILDPSVGLVNLNESTQTMVPLVLYGRVSKPGQYVFIVDYYMPTEPGLSIPVSVFVDGKEFTGMFNPHFCPSVVGCRQTIIFDASGGSSVRLTGTDIRAVFNGTKGGQIWLDYLLIVPLDQYSTDYVDLLPIDKSGDFLSMCVDEGFQLKSDSEFCRQGAFTLTTHFNSGALDCNCNPEGSLSFTCDGFGGQCECRDYIIGRQCSACRPGFYGFPNCQPCNCPFGLCHEVTGECICPPRVEGDRCERCEPEAYGYDALIGCQHCNCNYNGVVDRNLNCEQVTGQCDCKPNVGGRRCDTCLAGFHSFPYCQECNCDPRGTVDEICDQNTAECLCKDNVVGARCDRCSEGTYSLSAGNPKGCIKCFCFDHTTRCDSSDLKWDVIFGMRGWAATNSGNEEVQEAGSTIRISSSDNVLDGDSVIYWIAPPSYRGKKINSYGGTLEFTVLFTLPRDQKSEGIIQPDVIISGSNMTVVHFHHTQPSPSTSFKIEVPLREYTFMHEDTNAPVSKEQFMMILTNVDALLIRASYYTVVGEIRLSDVYMESASEDGVGEMAESVEMCQCPPSYVGLSCEDCAPGYWRARTTPYLGICVKCNCNGHSDECDVNTGECFNCRDNTTGSHCEQCLAGYYGDPATGPCRICSCPLPVPSNNFATTCSVSEDGYTTSCSCLPGYTGPLCEICDAGYYGDPLKEGSYCQPCGCNNNIDITNPDSCDRFTGACLLCMNDSGGPSCGRCREWYWGDAIIRKDCQACTCDRCGSESCDRDLGICQCKPNVEGANCEKCMPNTWGYGYCDGCRDCDCGVGSVTPQCDLYTGICECQPGVEGEKCDRCQPNHWNLGPSGCRMCDCLHDGAVGCDPDTGRCQCLPGVTGDKCDRCLPRWVLVPSRGCQECDYCVHLLLDDLDFLARNVSVISRQLGEVSVGVGAFNRLAHYNETVIMLRPQVDNLSNLDTENFRKMLEPVEADLVSVEEEASSLIGQTDNILFEAENLPTDVRNLTSEAAEVQNMMRDLNRLGDETLRFIRNVRQQLLQTSNSVNIDHLIKEGERITQEIASRNFTDQNVSSTMESELANDAREAVMVLKEKTMKNTNSTINLGDEISDISSDLYELQNSSRFSAIDADDAMNIIRRLEAVHLISLDKDLKIAKAAVKEREDLLKSAVTMLLEADGLFNSAETAVQGIESESSRLEQAIPELAIRVDEIENSLDGLTDATNSSQIHAAELAKVAMELDQMYQDTRAISENAVKAGQAYKNILSAIQEARNSSKQALEDSETARNESLGMGSNVSMAISDSQELLIQAQQLQSKTENDLKYKQLQAEGEVKMSEEDNMKIRDQLQELEDDMARLTGMTTADKSSAVDGMTRDAEAIVDQALEQYDPIKEKLKEFQDKNNDIVVNTPKGAEDLRQAQDNVDSAVKRIPEVETLLEDLSATASNLTEMGRSLEVSVETLKEKIARARDEANRIKVGLRFLGDTSVTVRNPSNLEDSGSYSKVSFFFKTNEPEALLLYVGNMQNTVNPNEPRLKRSVLEEEAVNVRLPRQATEFQTDFIALQIRGGRMLFTFNLGSGSARIYGNRQVNDGRWHQVIAERIGKTGTLTVKSKDEEDDVIEGTSQGTFVVLELNPITTIFLAGGVPGDIRLPRELTTQYFTGSMEDLKFDQEPVGLWNFVEGQRNYVGENQRDFMKEIFLEGVRFNGMGYAVLSRDTLRVKPDRTRMSMYFKTFAEQGMLFYMGNKDYFVVEINNGGQVVFSYDLGGGAAVLNTQGTYNDGEWHKITIDRNKRKALLLIDDKTEEISTESKGNLNNLETTDDLYIGGVDNSLILPSSFTVVGFDGCIKDLIIGTINVDPFDNKRGKGLVKGCAPKVAHIVSFPSTKTGYIGLDHGSIGSMFDVTFKVKTTESNALLMFATDSSQTNTFAVTLSDGRIVVSEELGSLSSQLASRINTYGDGKWHYISIMKMQQKITMSIDDAQMMEAQSLPGDLLTDTRLYFGGVPNDIDILSDNIPTTERLSGCLGDITLNKKFKNLANVVRSSSVTLTECQVEKTEVPTMPPDLSPDKCALPVVSSDTIQEDPEAEGVRYGASRFSRQEYNKLPVRIRIKPTIVQLTFKTSAVDGVMFYTSDKTHTDFMGLYIRNGQVNYGFNCGSGTALVTSPETYNDGKWHTIKFSRRSQEGLLEIDGEMVGTSRSPGSTRSINVKGPHYFGGLPDERRKKAMYNIGNSYAGFIGCMKDITFNMQPLGKANKDFDVQTCSESAETGTFLGSGGGYVTLYDKFRVGKNLEIVLDIRPRSQEGILLGVHGNGSDFLVLQMSEGEIIFTVDNGAGPITARYIPKAQNALCDGQWHTIRATKKGHIVQLAVDGMPATDVQEGKKGISSADTNDPLYVGGIADQSSKGIIANGDYTGCIRNLRLSNNLQYIASGTPTGDVSLSTCPVA